MSPLYKVYFAVKMDIFKKLSSDYLNITKVKSVKYQGFRLYTVDSTIHFQIFKSQTLQIKFPPWPKKYV